MRGLRVCILYLICIKFAPYLNQYSVIKHWIWYIFWFLFIQLQKIVWNKVLNIRIKELALKCTNVLLGSKYIFIPLKYLIYVFEEKKLAALYPQY